MDKEPSSEKNLEQRRQELELQRLELENKQLEFQGSAKSRRLELIRTLSGASFITGAVAIFTVIFSVVQWSSESSQNRTFKTEERLDKDLAVLADTSYRMRLSGVIALKGFLTKDHARYHAQVLAALTNMLSTEKECSVRNAINQTIEEIDTLVVPVKVLKQNLISLAGYSRFLVQSGNLRSRVPDRFFAPASHTPEAIANDVSKAMLSLLRKGVKAKDLSEVYCAECDFSGLNLSGCSFENAVLSWSHFNNCQLQQCNFNSADLERVDFTNADLSHARLTMNSDDEHYKNYIAKQIDKGGRQPAVFSPDFTNANLSYADFSGHILFGVHDLNTINAVLIFNPSFGHARLDSANLTNIGMYGTVTTTGNAMNPFYDDDFPVNGTRGSQWTPYESVDPVTGLTYNNYYAAVRMIDEHALLAEKRNRYAVDLNAIYASLSHTNWKNARLSPALRALLAEQEGKK